MPDLSDPRVAADCDEKSFSQGPDVRWRVAVSFLIILVSFFHLWRIADIPKGYYCDELSIGYNALLIADRGHDEHNKVFPVYFEAFGEFKNPLYVYTVALLYRIFGVSEFHLRSASFVFFILFLLGYYHLLTEVFGHKKLLLLYGIISAGFLPWFFTLSRISFEGISQLTMITFTLLFVYKTYHSVREKKGLADPLLAGLFLGVSVYSYSTARLLSFLFFSSLLTLYGRRADLKKSLLLAAAFALTIIPYVVFAISNSGALTRRFRDISYLFRPSLTVFQKATILIENYISYWGFHFLALEGNTNLRHATGYGGQLLIAVYILGLVGLCVQLWRGRLFNNRFLLLVVFNFLLAPLAGSLTSGPPDASRGILMGLFFLFLSCYGFSYIMDISGKMSKTVILAAAFAILLGQICLYLSDYFTVYAENSTAWFENYDFKRALIMAKEQKPAQIIVATTAEQPYVLLAYYGSMLNDSGAVPVRLGPPLPQKGACIIYSIWLEPLMDRRGEVFDLRSPSDSLLQVRCYR